MNAALALPSAFGQAEPSLSAAAELCLRSGFDRLFLDAGLLEVWLGRPQPIVPLIPPEDDDLTGLLELEEDVLRDSYELARSTFEASLGQWRRSVSLSPARRIQRTLLDAGLSVAGVDWRDFALDDALQARYACDATAAVGAYRLAVRYSARDPVHLGPFTADGLQPVFSLPRSSAAADYEAAFASLSSATFAIDLTAASDDHRQRLLTLLERSPSRVGFIRVRLDPLPAAPGELRDRLLALAVPSDRYLIVVDTV